MNKERLIRNLEAELLKLKRQDKVYGVGETRYDLMIKDVLNYIENSIPKEVIEKKIEELRKNGYWDFIEERDYEEAINILKKLLEEK